MLAFIKLNTISMIIIILFINLQFISSSLISDDDFSQGPEWLWKSRYDHCFTNRLPLIFRFKSRGKTNVLLSESFCEIYYVCRKTRFNGKIISNCTEQNDIGLKFYDFVTKTNDYDNWRFRVDDDIVLNYKKLMTVIEGILNPTQTCVILGSFTHLFPSGCFIGLYGKINVVDTTGLTNAEDMVSLFETNCLLFDINKYFIGEGFNKYDKDKDWIVNHNSLDHISLA